MPNTLSKILNFQICKGKIDYSKLNPKNFKFPRFKKFIKALVIIIIVLAAFIVVKDEFNYQFGTDYSFGDFEDSSDNSEEDNCNVLGIELHGDVVTYAYILDDPEYVNDQVASEDIVYDIQEADKDVDIKAIIIEIDSLGGGPVAGEEIAIALKKAKKPTVAIIRESGNSAAYMAATGADIIFASKYSDVGSIGVTMSYLENVNQNKKDGLDYISLTSGKFKDAGNPDKTLTEEEKRLFMRDVNIMHQNFVKLVAENRKMDITKVEKLADGSSMLGEMALENGLIDQIGGMYEVKDYLKEKIGKDVEICW